MELALEPPEQAADAEPRLRIEGADPGIEVALELRTVDAVGNRWVGTESVATDVAGSADVPLGDLLQRMEFDADDVAPTNFVAPPDWLEFELEATAGGDRAATSQVRRWRPAGIEPETVSGDGFSGRWFPAEGDAPRAAMLIIPGSTGVAMVEPRAALFAAHGYDVLLAAYMQEPGLPASLCEVPLESIAAAMAALRERTSSERVVVFSGSVGTGGMLAALAYGLIDADAAIALAPASVIWQALPDGGEPPKTGSWTLDGEVLPWASFAGERVLPEMAAHAIRGRFSRHPRPKALHLRSAYAAGLAKHDAAERAAIPVERIDCPLLLVAGDDDQMWPSAEMAAAIASRREAAGTGDGDVVLTLAGAGHFLEPPFAPATVAWNDDLVSGGVAEGNAAAQRQSWQAILDFAG